MLSQPTVNASLPVSDLERGRSFYENVLGLEAFDASAEGVFFRAGAGTFLEIYQSRHAGKNPATAAMFFVPDVEREVDALRKRGVTFEEYDFPAMKTKRGIGEFIAYKAAWFKDPDGNVLALFQRKR